MAIFNSVLVGGARNSVDNITMYESGGQRIARRKPMKVKNPRTEKQLRQRAKMKFLSELSVGFLEVAAVGFARRDARLSAANAFVQANMGNVTVDEDFVATMDYGLLACSADKKLKRPLVTATLSGSSLTFNLTAQEAWGSAKKDDQVYGVLFEEVAGESVLVALGTRGEEMSLPVDLPAEWAVENVHALCMPMLSLLLPTANGRRRQRRWKLRRNK